MKRTLVIIALALPMAGCLETITPEQAAQFQTLAKQAQEYQANVDQIQEKITDLAKSASPEAQAKIAHLQGELDRLQAQITPALAAMSAVQFEGKTGVQAFVEMAQAANTTTTGFNPYAGAINGVLALIGGVAALVARNKSKAAATATAKYEAHKIGVEKTMKELAVEPGPIVPAKVASAIYNNIGQARATA